MIRLTEQDNELITTAKKVDLRSSSKFYWGGEFGSNSKDYIQLLIYDENENFLESIILNIDDYGGDSYVWNKGEVKINTGTILRKNGYDRGRFILKFLFLRQVAGSDETVLVKKDGQIFGKTENEEFDKNNVEDMMRVTGGPGILPDLVIKDNKYWVEEISPTRTEVRILPENIIDKDYVDDFFNMQNSRKRLTTGKDDLPGIMFSGNDASEGDSRRLVFGSSNTIVDPKMLTNGKIFIPEVFVTSVTPPPTVYNLGDVNTNSFELDAKEEPSDIQASFFMDENAIKGDEYAWNYQTPGPYNWPWESEPPPADYRGDQNLHPGKYGDRFFEGYNSLFRRFNDDIAGGVDSAFDASLAGKEVYIDTFEFKDDMPQTPRNITMPKWTHFHQFRPVIFEQNGGVILMFKSNSTLVRQKDNGVDIEDNTDPNNPTTYTNQTTNYYWTVTGHDWDRGNKHGGIGFQAAKPGSDYNIITSQNTGVEGYNNLTWPVNLAQQSTNPYQAQTLNSVNGSTIILKINSSDAWMGLGLTVQQNTNDGAGKSTIHYPACIYTPHSRST